MGDAKFAICSDMLNFIEISQWDNKNISVGFFFCHILAVNSYIDIIVRCLLLSIYKYDMIGLS